MKRIGILSDTHGYLDDIDLVLEATADQDIDMWLHAGDYGDDAGSGCGVCDAAVTLADQTDGTDAGDD